MIGFNQRILPLNQSQPDPSRRFNLLFTEGSGIQGIRQVNLINKQYIDALYTKYMHKISHGYYKINIHEDLLLTKC